MDDEPPFNTALHFESSLDEEGPRNDQYTGAFFPKAQHLVVAGGKFKSITNVTQVAPTVPSDFRMIPMGDLDLREEIRPRHRSGVACRGQGRVSLRRVYSARVHGCKAKVTVAMYQGENAEEEWREDISRSAWLRHPNVVQLFATATSAGIHAAIFHDDLMPAKNVVDKYRGSHFSTVYLWNYLDTQFGDVRQYMGSVSGTDLFAHHCTMWIRCSTGRLCIDLTPPKSDPFFLYTVGVHLPSSFATSCLEPPENSKIIDSTPLDMYHGICFHHLGHLYKLQISPDASVQLGPIISCAAGTEIKNPMILAGIQDNTFQDYGWSGTYEELLVMEDGWTRISSSELEGGHIIVRDIFSDAICRRNWLAQANYTFNRLRITSNYNDYVFVHWIEYSLSLSDTGRIPAGYLFLCPLRDFESEIPSHFRRPESPAYWSLDPSGAKRLSTEEADELRFPRLKFKMDVYGYSWDESVYTRIRQFHQARGYNPYSQDVARELGFPLFQVLSELELFQETKSCSVDEDSDRLPINEVDGESDKDFSPVEGIRSRSDEAELLKPSRTWKIVMGVQFILILALSVFCLMG